MSTKKFWHPAALCLAGSIGLGFVTLVSYRLQLNLATVCLLYLIVIVLVAVVNGYIASAVVSIIAVLGLNYFFVPPRFTLRVDDPFDLIALVAFLVTSLLITRLMYAVKRTEASLDEAEKTEKRLQASLEEKEALLKEVHHRVKNNLQLISSLLNLQAARIKDPDMAELFADSRNRVRSMALVHENLYRAGNFARIAMAPHIQNLCAQLTRAYGMHSQHVELATRIDDVQLDLDRAISCGLIINELVSNALKHAFPDGRAGRIRVDLKLIEQARYSLVVGDDGIGIPPATDARIADCLGLQLVEDLTQQLHGAVAVDRDGGTTFTITFSAASSAKAGR